jgi:integrase
MRRELEDLIRPNGKGFVFSEDGGKSPVTMERINRGFEKALENTGIGHAERLKRNLSFHAWRHFFNTALRMEGQRNGRESAVGNRTPEQNDDRPLYPF